VIIARESGTVVARSPYQWQGEHTLAGDLIRRMGFTRRPRSTALVLPAHLDHATQVSTASSAAATLRLIGHKVQLAKELDPGSGEIAIPETTVGWELGERVGDRISQATHSDDVALALLELTAPASGVLHAVAQLIDQTAGWWWNSSPDAEAYDRLDAMAGRARQLAADLDRFQNEAAVADRTVNRSRAAAAPSPAAGTQPPRPTAVEHRTSSSPADRPASARRR